MVPIIPDEARTFGMDAPVQGVKIYAAFGQLYEPVDAELLLSYREVTARPDPRGGHHRGGLDGSFTAAGTSYATHGQPMVPFFIFYSMFGFQRVGDLIWAARRPARPRLPARRDRRPHDAAWARGSSTTTATARCWRRPCPNLAAYDPAFAYEWR